MPMRVQRLTKWQSWVVVTAIYFLGHLESLPTLNIFLQNVQCLSLGLVAAVKNLTVHSHQSFILLTWVRPFSLDITGVDRDLWYCVEVYNITRQKTPLTTNCSVYEPKFYFYTTNPSPCHKFEFTVFAVNKVGNGSVASVNGTFFEGIVTVIFPHLVKSVVCLRIWRRPMGQTLSESTRKFANFTSNFFSWLTYSHYNLQFSCSGVKLMRLSHH